MRTPAYPFSDDRWSRIDAAPGFDLVLVSYLLFAAAFLMPPLAAVGVGLAYLGRGRAGLRARTHFDRQISVFWRSLLALLAIGLLHAAVTGLGAITFGFGLVLMVLPWGLGIGWLVWAAWEIGSGLLAAWRREPV
ncbi:hypothetical protein NFI95_12585 [Acetobacteraceae bacterium KSS8]|uniref:DUF4870 domain-containing protein n=1 Tax=Endosaccharibacter trunci TaxID=2812733 RepID=A0ABT1W953_9PROT|nr:hypothetical protein [Acetobacteraceae bacterium KSS8]